MNPLYETHQEIQNAIKNLSEKAQISDAKEALVYSQAALNFANVQSVLKGSTQKP